MPPDILAELKRRHAEKPRVHHSWDNHIVDMLEQFGSHVGLIKKPAPFFAAIVFHDSVYDPERRDNEQQSIELFRKMMGGKGDAVEQGWTECLIAATRKHEMPPPQDYSRDWLLSDTALFLDMDLSILGAEEGRYHQYMKGIRREYGFAPDERYLPVRRQVMKAFLERDRIFLTDEYRERFEAQARTNIEREIGLIDLVLEHHDPAPALAVGAQS